MNNPYKILGVSIHATAAEIKTAYRKLAREHHPDLDKNSTASEEKFKAISSAYNILSNDVTRGQFDRGEITGLGAKNSGGTRPRSSRPDYADSRNRTDSNSKTSRMNIKVNGADVEYNLTLGFLDAVKGGDKYISTTNGTRLKVTVPPGIENGRTLRLKGQGMPGFGGGTAGDAMVDITVSPDPMFRRVETDILLDLPVTLPEAVLGAKVQVPTIDGMVSLSVPPASNTGTILRLKGRGLPLAKTPEGDPARGDQYVTLQVVLPKKQDKEFTDFVKAWSEKNAYDVSRKRVDT